VKNDRWLNTAIIAAMWVIFTTVLCLTVAAVVLHW